MSDCALFPASPSRNRVWSVWADKESHLSLVGRTFTCICLRVQPFLFLDLVGVIIYGLATVIHYATNRTPSYDCVISTAPHFSASGGKAEDGGIEPLGVNPPRFSRPVADHLAASSIQGCLAGLVACFCGAVPVMTGSTKGRQPTAKGTISGIKGI